MEENNLRLKLAAQITQGLLASQDPVKGWNLDTLSILSLKIADNLIKFDDMETLPELVSSTEKDGEKS